MFSFIFLAFALLLVVPLAGTLVYVWYKFGKEDRVVVRVRMIFMAGLLVVFSYMTMLLF